MLSQTISNRNHLWALSTAVGLAVGFPVGCCSETRSSFGPALKNGGLTYLLPIRCLGWHRSVRSQTNLVGGGLGHGPLGSRPNGLSKYHSQVLSHFQNQYFSMISNEKWRWNLHFHDMLAVIWHVNFLHPLINWYGWVWWICVLTGTLGLHFGGNKAFSSWADGYREHLFSVSGMCNY